MKFKSDFMNSRRFGFTLAEMMVVMLILSIVLAVAAPIMTTKQSRRGAGGAGGVGSDNDVWNWVTGHPNDAQTGAHKAVVGQADANADSGVFIINQQDGVENSHILFKRLGENSARLHINGSSLSLGSASITGNNNTAMGIGALAANTTGQQNTAIGNNALNANTTGSQNIAIGSGAFPTHFMTGGPPGNHPINRAIAIGFGADPTSHGAIAIGASSSSSMTGIAIGESALAATGSIAIGSRSYNVNPVQGDTWNNDSAIASRTYAIAIGNNSQATGVDGIAIGRGSRAGQDSIAIGNNVLSNNSTGTNNIVIGVNSLSSNTTGKFNIAIGNNALSNNSTGNNNIAIGENACSKATGSGIVCIGTSSGPPPWDNPRDWMGYNEQNSHLLSGPVKSTNNIVYIGNDSATVYIPGNLVVGGQTVLGLRTKDYKKPNLILAETDARRDMVNIGYITNDGESFTNFKSGYAGGPPAGGYSIGPFKFDALVQSDRRLKYVGQESKAGLDKIRQLKVFNYTFKRDEKKTPHVGVIAQDLQKIFPNAVTTGRDGYLMIRMEDMFYAVINAIKELDAHIRGLEQKIIANQKDIKQLKQENKELKARLDKLEAKLK